MRCVGATGHAGGWWGLSTQPLTKAPPMPWLGRGLGWGKAAFHTGLLSLQYGKKKRRYLPYNHQHLYFFLSEYPRSLWGCETLLGQLPHPRSVQERGQLANLPTAWLLLCRCCLCPQPPCSCPELSQTPAAWGGSVVGEHRVRIPLTGFEGTHTEQGGQERDMEAGEIA